MNLVGENIPFDLNAFLNYCTKWCLYIVIVLSKIILVQKTVWL